VNKTFTWTYLEGSHIVRAIADSNGWIQEDDETNNEREEIIGNLPPVASFSCNGCNYFSNPIAYVRKSTHFNATESYDPDGSIISFCWDFGDGNVTTVTEPVITHNYTRIGNYTVTLNVTDNLGMWHTATGNVTVKLKCDLNDDGVVNVVDVTIVSVA
jgi:PKD repeat protein